MPEVLRGKGVIAGVAIGQIMIVGQALDEYLKDYSKGSAEEEKAKVEPAVALVTEAIEKNVADLNAQGMEEQAAIMEAHGMLVQDPMFIEAMLSKAEEMGNAPAAVLEAAKETAALFEMMDDDYMRERAADIRDIGKRVAKAILGIKDPELGDKKVILCGHEIEPSVIANIPTESIAGVILGQGSTTCHAVIIAKARAIPTVVGLGDSIDKIPDDAYTAIDGEAGEIIINPADDVLAGLEEKIRIQKEQEARYMSLKDLPAVTKDGVSVHLAANIGLPEDAKAAAAFGNEGVGLFRS